MGGGVGWDRRVRGACGGRRHSRGCVRTAAAPRAAPSAFDADLAETLRRTRELRRRVDALKAGFEATARREEATMRALIDTTRRAADPPPR